MAGNYHPLTQAQKRIWYTEYFYPGTSIANLGGFGRLKSEEAIDTDVLINAIHEVVRKNDTLRLRLAMNDTGEPVQYVSDYEEFQVEHFDLTSMGGKFDPVEWGREDAQKPIPLYENSLFHFAVFRISDVECGLYMKIHHIIADGISVVLVVNQIIDMYLLLIQGKAAPELSETSYVDYIHSEMEYAQSDRFQKDKAYWGTKFSTVPEMTSLKQTNAVLKSTRATRFSKAFTDETKRKVQEFCSEFHVSILTLFLALVDIYLYRVTGHDDIVVGTFMGNRTNAKEKQMLGMFVSTIPIRTHIDEKVDFLSFVRQKTKDQLATIRHQKYPYTVLVDDLRDRYGNMDRLFGISLEYQVMQWVKKEGLLFMTEPYFSGHEMNDVSIHLKERWDNDTLAMDIDYRAELLSNDEIESFYRGLMALLDDALSHPTEKICDLEICSAEEKEQLMRAYHSPRISFSRDHTIHRSFEEQVSMNFGKPAVVSGENEVSYEELNRRANQLGWFLRGRNVSRNTPVAICMNRNENQIIAILGVLKAGGAYVPIDPDLPRERIRFMIEDSGARVLITEEGLLSWFDTRLAETVLYNSVRFRNFKTENLPPVGNAEDLAYVIYTSGTTGRPKGVMIAHRQVQHLVASLHKHIYVSYESPLHLALVAAFHFDASVQQIFASLLLGHTLHIVPKASARDGNALADYYRTHQIDVMDGTPSHLQLLLSAENLEGVSVRHMLIGGEALLSSTVRGIQKLFAKSHASVPIITNVYGPTECCVDASAYDVFPEKFPYTADTVYMPIGKPLGNHRLYILDAHGKVQPQGVQGELYIAGEGVGQGYLNLPKLTAKRFIVDPFVQSSRMYKTGDLARLLPDGNIEFIGRIDDQVKIRGYRIELGEIESVLQKHEHISRAVVLARSNGGTSKELCAYFVRTKASSLPLVDELKAHLAATLPNYMVPTYFVELDEIPLTANGKVDRKVLQTYELTATSSTEYVSPVNETEEQLARIWQNVLGASQVGVNDSFFELGGHSLKAIQLLSRVHKHFNVEVPLTVLYETPTIRAMSEYISTAVSCAFMSIEPVQKSKYYPLSYAQKRIYLSSQLEDGGISYNMPAAIELNGPLDIPKLQNALDQLIARHESLRTSFVLVDGVPVQEVHNEVSSLLTVIQGNEEILETAMKSFARPFDLTSAPLMRTEVIKIARNKHVLLIDLHHLISDGISSTLILEDLTSLYMGEELSPLQLQYKDFAVWQTGRLVSDDNPSQKYWLNTFDGVPPLLQLMTDYQRPQVQSFAGDRVSQILGMDLKEQLNRLAESHGTTLYVVMLSAYFLLLMRYTGQEDIVVGTPVAGRNHPDLEKIVGMFVNTLAVRTAVMEDEKYADLLGRVSSSVLGALEHQDYPFEQLVDALNLPRDLSRNPLFDTMFSLQNTFDKLPNLGEVRMSVYNTNFHVAKFDLTLQAREEADFIMVDLDYNTSLYRIDTARRMVEHYVNILRSIAADPDIKIGAIPLLGEEEEQQILVEFNQARKESSESRTIVSLFEERAKERKESTAVVFENQSLTYSELNARANQLARALQSHGVKDGSIVALCLNRSAQMVVSILAILKAGGTYVPIDPEYPEHRIQFMLSDSGASVLLTEGALGHMIANLSVSIPSIMVEDEKHYQNDASNLMLPIDPGTLANLTYTTGTTGTPKGNMVTHSNIVQTMMNMNYIEVTSQDVVLSISNYVFDAFMFDLFGSLLCGAKLVIAPKQTILDISRLPHLMKQEQITVLMITTALFNLLVDIRPDCFRTIRKILFGGERASVDHVRKAIRTVGAGKLVHMYGPSESTVFATYYPVDEVPEDAIAIPIGKPVSHRSVYVLNAYNQLQPIGTPGELCVGGEGLVLGYANRSDLTATRFVPHPFEHGQRIYRTGDMVRQLPNGNIEFIGRIDQQVKIRGHRIELGEIEHQLLRHHLVREAAVIAFHTESGDHQLCAYVVLDGLLSNSELRTYLLDELPAYMVPAAIVEIEKLPLTANGKVDRKALPKPDFDAVTHVEYVAPRNETEEKVANIWREVLGVERISVRDNFFDLGGHSLTAMKLIAQIQQAMHVELSLRDLFQLPTIEELTRHVQESNQNLYYCIPEAEEAEFYPLTSAQKRLYVLSQLKGAGVSYNMPAALRIQGPVNLEQFEKTIQSLISRHDALRTSFETVDGVPVQRIHEDTKLNIVYSEASVDDVQGILSKFIRPFSLHEAPLLRVELVRITQEHHLLLFDMHHIISDGVSVKILMDEIAKLYGDVALDSLPISYKDYAVWQQTFHETEAYQKQKAYWLVEFADEIPVLNLPTDHARPSIQSFSGDCTDFIVDAELTQALKQLAQSTETTLYMVLLAAYSTFLCKLSGQDEIVVGSPIAGRPHADLMNIIGMFVNTLAIRTSPQSNRAFSTYLQDVKEKALGAYESQDYPFEELVQNIDVRRDISRNPLFDALFVLQSTDIRSLQMGNSHLEICELPHTTAKFDLSLSAIESEDTILCSLEYSTALFEKTTIERWIGHFVQILRQVSAYPDIQIADINLLTKVDEQKVLQVFNETAYTYPKDKTIHQLFEEQVERAPGHIALVVNDKPMSYRELNEKANRLARCLRLKGIGPDNLVGVMVDDARDMVVSILAVLKAGGAYVPIDPGYPEDRIRYLLEDSKIDLAVTSTKCASRLPGINLQYIDNFDETRFEPTNLVSISWPTNLAYVIYTSGSTGKPKGVMVEHQNIVRLVKNAGYIPLDETCKMAQTGAISFDATTFELFGALLNGGSLYPVDRNTLLDTHRFEQFLKKNQITTMWLTSPLFNQLAQIQPDMFGTLEHMVVGGDALSPGHIEHVREACPNLKVWNGYGPTENTTFSTCMLIDKRFVDSIPIGKPIGNSTAYILGSNDLPVPIGIPGELCVGGDGVARGYLNRPELTAEKFVKNPFVPGTRMYRTGDLAKWLLDGNIEFLGRIDRQVKVRGFRIELGEIESQLVKIEGIQDAIVTPMKNMAGENSLSAYVVGDGNLTISELRMALSEVLPSYMVPSYFIKMDKLPLTQNGKVDYRALPVPTGNDKETDYKAPRNEAEMVLVEVWQEVLGGSHVGISDNFFELGGDSIKAIQMVARLHARGWKLEMKYLFQQPTIEQVAVYLNEVEAEEVSQEAVEGKVKLTPIQQWFFERQFTNMNHWNQSVLLRVPDGLDAKLVKTVLNRLAEHHDALRMVFQLENGQVVQYNRGLNNLAESLEVVSLDATRTELEQAISNEANRIQASLDLTNGPLFRTALFQTQNGDYLLMVIHHLVVDGVSWRILIEDFVSGYLEARQGNPIVLPDKTHSFQEWSEKLVEYANSRQCQLEANYWKQIQNSISEPLPRDFKTTDTRMKHTRGVEFSLTPTDTFDLTHGAHAAYRTEVNDILLTALGYALQEWTSGNTFSVLLEGHGREEIGEAMNVSRTVGWFTTQYPIILNMAQSTDLAYQIKRIKEDIRHIPNKGIGYGLLRYLSNNVEMRECLTGPVPEISFNYLGQFDEPMGDGWITRSRISTGHVMSPETERMSPIDMIGYIEDGALHVSITYNSLEFAQHTIEHLSEKFKTHLVHIVRHCMLQDVTAITPSDLGDTELTLDELDAILEML